MLFLNLSLVAEGSSSRRDAVEIGNAFEAVFIQEVELVSLSRFDAQRHVFVCLDRLVIAVELDH